MLTLPAVMVTLLLPFERLFDPRTWRKAQLLAMGAILSPGKRTLSSALNILGIGQHGDFAIYHHVLNRAQWSPLQLSRALLLLVAGRLGSSTEPLVFGMVGLVKPQEGRLGPIGPAAAGSHLAAQHLGVKLERPFKIGNQNPHMSNALDLNAHNKFLLAKTR